MKNYYFTISLVVLVSCNNELTNTKLKGPIFGTFYEVSYAAKANENYQKALDSIFEDINQSMSNDFLYSTFLLFKITNFLPPAATAATVSP